MAPHKHLPDSGHSIPPDERDPWWTWFNPERGVALCIAMILFAFDYIFMHTLLDVCSVASKAHHHLSPRGLIFFAFAIGISTLGGLFFIWFATL